MRYKLILQKDAQKDLDKIDQHYFQRIIAAFSRISEDPYVGKKLHGEYRRHYTYKVWPYRIIYIIEKQEITVFVVKVGHRQGVY